MSDTSSKTIRHLLRNYVNAPTWAASREIVTQHREILLTEEADVEFATWIAEEEAATGQIACLHGIGKYYAAVQQKVLMLHSIIFLSHVLSTKPF